MIDDRFTEAELQKLEQVGPLRVYEPGQTIYFAGEPADSLYIIREGRVRVLLDALAGDEMTLEIVEKGRIFGESSFQSCSTRPTTVIAINHVALIDCTIATLLPYLQQDAELLTKLLQFCSNTMNHLSYLLHDVCFLDRYGRVASLLLRETAQANPDKGITENCLPYTHEEIGWCLGLSRATVSRVLQQFRCRGWIRSTYRKIEILNRGALRNVISVGL